MLLHMWLPKINAILSFSACPSSKNWASNSSLFGNSCVTRANNTIKVELNIMARTLNTASSLSIQRKFSGIACQKESSTHKASISIIYMVPL